MSHLSTSSATDRQAAGPGDLAPRFAAIRSATESLVAPLSPEDAVVQSMPDASPAKWHLAHTTWFFETFLLENEVAGYRPVDPSYRILFNSYYNTVGEQHPRPRRGMLTRPSLDEVLTYRRRVDDALLDLLRRPEGLTPRAVSVIEVGLQHEQQHQELILMDIKHLLACHPLRPAYAETLPSTARDPGPMTWIEQPGGDVAIGHRGDGFAFDNELPRHTARLQPFALANRPVTVGEFLEFMADGGYSRPEIWLSDGWALAREQGWHAPGYWEEKDGVWHQFTLGGLRPVRPEDPVCHLSYYEADAFARRADARLPTEAEWESVAAGLPVKGHFVDSGRLHPDAVEGGPGYRQVYGDVWEWTCSAYGPYPGYRAPAGAIGEYNGKFMVNQMVLRGGACVSAASHLRATYRNFFYPHMRWQFAGLRLARDVERSP